MRVVRLDIPPDKSISHRAIMLASISEGTTCIKNLLLADDCLRTIEVFRAMGVRIDPLTLPFLLRLRQRRIRLGRKGFGGQAPQRGEGDITVHGVGLRGLKKPDHPLYLGNSGTTMRILPGILAGQDFSVVLKGDNSLSSRPMQRIVEPLRKMGAEVSGTKGARKKEIYPPLKIHGGRLKPIKYKTKIASAQVKSCILLAGLFAKGVTAVSEPVKSRDHTERMLKMFGADVHVKGHTVSIVGASSFRPDGGWTHRSAPTSCVSSGRIKNAPLHPPGTIEIPGDISSAAFFIVAACILPNIKLILKNIGLNPTRTGILDILKRMGANIKVYSSQFTVHSWEPRGDIIVKSSKLKGAKISPKDVVRSIDEIPILMLAACFAKGKTVIKGIGELRVKETDRIKSMVTNLRKMGADVDVGADLCVRPKDGGPIRRSAPTHRKKEKIIIHGTRPLHGARVSSFGDHRTAMSMLVAGLVSKKRVTVTGLESINKSFPGFEKLLRRLV